MMNQLFDKNMVLATIASFQTPYRKEHKVEDIYEAVSALPTAQPDLSKYSDKLWRNAYERGKRDALAELPIKGKCIVCPHCDNCDVNDDGTIAQPKTGKWIEVHGFCTPGGDPVWACSECGKGRHVYGIEHGSYGRDVSDGQWKACPNCGCRMDGEADD